MFSSKLKAEIAEKVQAILQETGHDELPEGEIEFLLHVDGEEDWSWANIRNSALRDVPAPSNLVCNMSASNKRVQSDECLLGGKHEWITQTNGEYTKTVCSKCRTRR